MNSFRHSGKLGDIIYSLPAVRALGGGIFYVDASTTYFEKPALGRATAQMMVDLLETQEYIHGAAIFNENPSPVTSIAFAAKRFRFTSSTSSILKQTSLQVFFSGTRSESFGKSLSQAWK